MHHGCISFAYSYLFDHAGQSEFPDIKVCETSFIFVALIRPQTEVESRVKSRRVQLEAKEEGALDCWEGGQRGTKCE